MYLFLPETGRGAWKLFETSRPFDRVEQKNYRSYRERGLIGDEVEEEAEVEEERTVYDVV